MLDLNKPVSTRNGTAVRILCTDARGIAPIKGLVTHDEVDWVYAWDLDGKRDGCKNYVCGPWDLINPVVKRWRWAYTLSSSRKEFITCNHYTEDEMKTYFPCAIIIGKIEATEREC